MQRCRRDERAERARARRTRAHSASRAHHVHNPYRSRCQRRQQHSCHQNICMLTTSRSPSSSRCRRVKVNVTKVHKSERLALAARLRHQHIHPAQREQRITLMPTLSCMPRAALPRVAAEGSAAAQPSIFFPSRFGQCTRPSRSLVHSPVGRRLPWTVWPWLVPSRRVCSFFRRSKRALSLTNCHCNASDNHHFSEIARRTDRQIFPAEPPTTTIKD